MFIQELENVATFTDKWGLNMIYDNKNSIFKISLYGIPNDHNYQDRKLGLINVSTIAKIPIYIGEWNHVDREKNHQQIPMISVK